MGEPTEPGTDALWPARETWGDAQYVQPPHPAIIETDDFLNQCRLTSHRRGGPGGQHRNKVSSAVMAVHEPTGVSAEANERRDQSQNRRMAIERLRARMALVLRTVSGVDAPIHPLEAALRDRWHGRSLKIAETNFARSAVMALVLDDLHRAGGQPSLVAAQWKVSTSSVVNFVAAQPAAFQLVNRWREHHGRSPLRS